MNKVIRRIKNNPTIHKASYWVGTIWPQAILILALLLIALWYKH